MGMIQTVKSTKAVIEYLERDIYVNLNCLYFLRNFGDADVYLYNGDVENGLILGTEEQNFFYLSTYDPGFLDEFWESLRPGHKCFSGVPKPITDIFLKGKQIVWDNPCKGYALKGAYKKIEDARYAIDCLTAADAEEVNEYYTFKSEDSLEHIMESITLRDSSCVRINGRLAAWCAVHPEDNSMGPLYTKEEYRGLGLAALVTTRLMGKLIAKGFIPYIQIVEGNTVSEHVAGKISGMEYTHGCIWFGIDKIAKK